MIMQGIIDDDVIIMPIEDIYLLLKEDNRANLIAVYTFLQCYKKWPTTTELNLSEDKISKAKEQLISMRLI